MVRTSCRNVLAQCLGNIQRTSDLRIFITKFNDQDLLELAQAADERWEQGKQKSAIDGMPIAVKDAFCMKGVKASAGSKMLDNFVPTYDSTVVKKLKDAGAIIVGKTNMDEFAMGSFGTNSYYGATLQEKLDQEGNHVVAGGSSSGSAAAVSTGCCVAAIGSDTGGSVRLPAAYCNIFSIKPSYGRISRWGLISYASSLDTAGILSTNIGDGISILNEIAGPDDKDSTCIQEDWGTEGDTQTHDIRIGIPEEFYVEELPQHTLDAWHMAASEMENDLPATLVPVSLPCVKDALPAYYVIACAEASSNLARYDGIQYGFRTQDQADSLHDEYIKTRTQGFGDEVKRRILMGSHVLSSDAYEDFYVRADNIRTQLRRDFDKAFEQTDFLLSPVSCTETAPSIDQALAQDPVHSYLSDIMTVPASLAGLPCVTIPRTDGQSMQIMAPYGADRRLASFLGRLGGAI